MFKDSWWVPLPENSLPLKMVVGRRSFPFGFWPILRGKLWVVGYLVICFCRDLSLEDLLWGACFTQHRKSSLSPTCHHWKEDQQVHHEGPLHGTPRKKSPPLTLGDTFESMMTFRTSRERWEVRTHGHILVGWNWLFQFFKIHTYIHPQGKKQHWKTTNTIVQFASCKLNWALFWVSIAWILHYNSK